MYRVLLPVDGNVDRALEQASFVAALPVDPADLSVTVVHALTEEGDQQGELRQVGNVRSVRRAVEALREAGFDPEVDEIGEPPAETIRETAEALAADLVVMGAGKRSAAREAMFGSVSRRVIRGTDRPVTVVGPAVE
ncbi:universal stress protein [Halobium salinum]|uniref:Universal stress protein n=1 Tax=Halobium salinum TaxID=1364940 RepID=A0ABD5P832_9EURY|nr:universal stress protein [Halobium salinum]